MPSVLEHWPKTLFHKIPFKNLNATSHTCLRVFDVNFRQDYYNSKMVFQSLVLANAVKMNEDEFLKLERCFSKNLKRATIPDQRI